MTMNNVQQYANFSISQEKAVINSLHFVHKKNNQDMLTSIIALNRSVHIYDEQNENILHILFEKIAKYDRKYQGLLAMIMSIIGNFDCLNIWQINYYLQENNYFLHNRSLHQIINLLIKNDLIEQLNYQFTDDNNVNQCTAYSLTNLGRALINHFSKISVINDPKPLIQPLNNSNGYIPYMQCWQAYDLDVLIKQYRCYINSFLHVFSNEHSQNNIVYHVTLFSKDDNNIVELNVYLPTWNDIFDINGSTADLSLTKLQNYINTQMSKTFITSKLPNHFFDNYQVHQFSMIRLLPFNVASLTTNLLKKITVAYHEIHQEDNSALGIYLTNNLGNDDLDKHFCFYNLQEIMEQQNNLMLYHLHLKQ